MKDKRSKASKSSDSGESSCPSSLLPDGTGTSTSSMERLQETFQALTSLFEEGKKSVQKKEEALRQEFQALHSEKEAMTNSKVIKGSDIIQMNVGGTKMTSTRETLCQYPSSLLTYMFSGRWDEQLSTDLEGCVFFDTDPELFKVVLNWLRTQRLAGPASIMSEVVIPQRREEDMLILVDYLQLQRYLPLWYVEVFNPDLRSPGIQVRSNAAERMEGNGSNYAVAVSAHSYFDVSVELTLRVSVYDCTEACGRHPFFVGVIAKDTVLSHPLKDRWDLTWQKTCYGWWTRPGTSYQVVGGKSRKLSDTALFKGGDQLLLSLDCRKDSEVVTLKLQNLAQSSTEQELRFDPSELGCPEEWVLVVGITKQGNSVSIESARRKGVPAWKFR